MGYLQIILADINEPLAYACRDDFIIAMSIVIVVPVCFMFKKFKP